MAIRVTLSLNLKKSVVKPHTKGYREVGASSDCPPSGTPTRSDRPSSTALCEATQDQEAQELQLRALLSFLPQQQGSHPPGCTETKCKSFFLLMVMHGWY